MNSKNLLYRSAVRGGTRPSVNEWVREKMPGGGDALPKLTILQPLVLHPCRWYVPVPFFIPCPTLTAMFVESITSNQTANSKQ